MQAFSGASGKGSALEQTTLPTARRTHASDGNGYQKHLDEKISPLTTAHAQSAPSLLTNRDRNAIALLIVLYFIQGIPIGLAFGSIPFLLKSRLSYTQIGTFSLSTYPYSLKLFWSPIIDSVYHPQIGRRKSWIVPIQAILGSLMIWMGRNSEELLKSAEHDISKLTFVFVTLVFFAATQDIAVDGWALTLLSGKNLSYASTAQTVGLNSGYFLSFTVFLALNSPEFANKYFRAVPSAEPFLNLGGYLKFWGYFCFVVTLWLFFFKREDPVSAEEEDTDISVRGVYRTMWKICQLKQIQTLVIIHLVAKIGFQANDAATDLKLMEKGLLTREDLALVALIDFPLQLVGGWVAARWSTGDHKLRPWLQGYVVRLAFALASVGLVKGFNAEDAKSRWLLLLIIVVKVLTSFASTFQFVGVSAFHTHISDPVVGGTYMTLLNTISNLGGTWPRWFVLTGVDVFSSAMCHVNESTREISCFHPAQECSSESGRERCKGLGGECVTEFDGYYTVSLICVALGAILLVGYIWPKAKQLQALPLSSWRVNMSK
ncbi:acetyl-coenzyme A transporter 1-domain-containing protein [Cantharellus anzutake]|uniref:acetyl-coenzyme A transporter 1-domain-containing protein n=1 Tax=Cantharellus anzutake TaxID=1750568 RepID=UPI001905AB1B|nr:acetyl-coenzyme A transporter 1-domain-containing protein [Cantharellus anzutake]KAF8339901.1 acetyl-coenzyme A transporter 1-domain-containing protein [Cantharellus anzutake]